MSDNKNLLIGVGLILGAVYMSRRPAARPYQGQGAPRAPTGPASMPGNIGTGVSQVLGGLLGNLLAPKTGGGTANGVPVSNSGYDFFPPMVGDAILQNNVGAADPNQSYDPTSNGPSFDPTEGMQTGYEGYA